MGRAVFEKQDRVLRLLRRSFIMAAFSTTGSAG